MDTSPTSPSSWSSMSHCILDDSYWLHVYIMCGCMLAICSVNVHPGLWFMLLTSILLLSLDTAHKKRKKREAIAVFLGKDPYYMHRFSLLVKVISVLVTWCYTVYTIFHMYFCFSDYCFYIFLQK